jgi:hypothetical protein
MCDRTYGGSCPFVSFDINGVQPFEFWARWLESKQTSSVKVIVTLLCMHEANTLFILPFDGNNL